MLFQTRYGCTEDSPMIPLQPETAQGIFTQFPAIVRNHRPRLPFGGVFLSCSPPLCLMVSLQSCPCQAQFPPDPCALMCLYHVPLPSPFAAAGVGQVGKSFRNEISPGHMLFRMREFEQMELEFFCKPEEATHWWAD